MIQKKNVLITGATRGIGETVTRYLYEKGYYVIMVARNEDRLKKLRDEFGEENSCYFVCDLTQLEQIENIFSECKSRQLKLDSMIHCAGTYINNSLRMNVASDMMQMYLLNTMAFTELCKFYGSKRYSNENGCILAISSMSADACDAGMCNYSASKAALNASARVIAKELVKRNIRVNTIMPATVMTQEMENYLDIVKEREESGTWVQPLGFIPPIQIAYMVDFLLSDRANYITGACIPISAGAF